MKSPPILWGARTLVGASVLAATTVEARANLISYRCMDLASVFVVDGDPFDDDPAKDSISHDFSCDYIQDTFSWHAEGTLIGVFSPPESATTRIANLRIENTAGNVNAQQFLFDHIWESPLGPPTPNHTATIAGHCDNDSGMVNGCRIQWRADVFDLVGGFENIMIGVLPEDGFNVTGPPPIPFEDEEGPVSILTPIKHEIVLNFYLDSPGDSIVMGEGEGMDVGAAPIPEPSGAVLTLMAAVWLGRRRHCVLVRPSGR